MRPRTSNWRGAIGLLAVLAFVFAPAWDEGPISARPDAKEPLGAYILVPIFREAILAVGPKFTSHYLQVINQRSRPDSVPLAVPPAVTPALLFLLASLVGGFLLRSSPRLIAFPPQTPRGPPAS